MEGYCKAIEYAKLPPKPGPRGASLYDEERFQEFVNTDIDIRDLRHHMADFTQSSGVAQALHTIRSCLHSGLQQNIGCLGSLSQIGSFYDGSKTGRLNEMDCLYVISESDIRVQEVAPGQGQFRVYVKGIEIKPRELNKTLITAMKKTLSEMILPEGWTHGGYASREFSGVRCNGPAVTAMFCNKDENHISLDVSIAFPLKPQLQQRADFPLQLREHCQYLKDNISRIQSELTGIQVSADLHLIGNLVDNTWQVTTALAEAEILRALKPDCSVKRALEIFKALASKLQAWYEGSIAKYSSHDRESLPVEKRKLPPNKYRGVVLEDLYHYKEADPESKVQIRDRLNTEMAFQHIWLSSSDREDYKEVLKSDASINTAAMKHIILRTALQLNGAFSKSSKQLEQQLIRAVLEELSSTDSFYTQHALIPDCMISKFSVSMYMSPFKESIANDFSQQCEFLLDNALAKKTESRWRHIQTYQHEYLEYCYKIEVEVTPSSNITSVATAEYIAMVLSALFNSGGGVLVIHLVTKAGNIKLDRCKNDIVRLITQQEMWIPENVFNDTISLTKDEAEKEIHFFANKTTHLVSHNSNTYYFKQSSPECIVNNNSLTDVIRACVCEHDTVCVKHNDLARKNNILSMLANLQALNAHQLFPAQESESDTHFYRNYQLNDRSLTDVLNIHSVRCEILELVSALANTKGGSIFLGVTNTTTPTVEGYRLTEEEQQCMTQNISDLLTGRNAWSVTVWGNQHIKSTHYWKTFFHKVVGNCRKVIEIRVSQCPGGMFCSLPVCLDIRDTGEIYQVDSFAEWKKRVLNESSGTFLDEEHDDTDCYHKHFERKEMIDNDTPPDINMAPTGTSSTVLKPPEQTSSSEFYWWISDDGVVTESLRFDQCCSKELADSEIDISTTFSTFPPTEAIIERFGSIEGLGDILQEILKVHQIHNGVAVFLENLQETTLPIYALLKDITPGCHIFDLVVLKEYKPPVVVSVFKDKSSREDAKNYCLKLGQLLKRDCSKYMGMAKNSMKFFFHGQLYFIDHGYEIQQQEGLYPNDYQHPSPETLHTVRYALARILLDCQHITDRYGHIMVRHLSSYQAKILLGRRAKVLLVKAIAGSGKTVLALEIARRLKRRHRDTRKIAFLCRSRGLAAFVQSQVEGIRLFESVIQCNSQQITELDSNLFSRYTDIIIDDAHAIPVIGERTSWTMYTALFSSLEKRPGHAYIFLDTDMQDYRGCTPGDFVTQLEVLAGQYVGKYNVKTEPLGKILRNSRRICQFTKACMGTDDVEKLSTGRQIPEDGVFFDYIQGRRVTLLSRLSSLKQYRRRDITILTDNQEDKKWVKKLLKGKYPTRNSAQSPAKHVVVDTLENFKGSGSPVIVFITPQFWDSAYVEAVKYRLSVVTRTISRLEFLVLSQRQEDMAELHKALSLAVPEDGVFFHYMQDREARKDHITTLLSRLSSLRQYSSQDITILTDNQEGKVWVNEIMKDKYETQDVTIFPVNHIVVDTLENFEGLESPVILFIIPQSWGSGYVGSLKYRLCVVTRAISRLEFLLPWDDSQRQQDLAELKRAFLFWPPVDYGSLEVTQEHWIQAGVSVWGMCYHSGRLYTVERRMEDGSYRRRLAVYNVNIQDTMTLLDTLDLEVDARKPHIDCQTGQVYIPCTSSGVCVVRYDGSKLVPVTTLRCVGNAAILAVASTDILYVSDWDSKTVCLVDVTQDRVTARLQPRWEVRDDKPNHMAVLGDTVLVVYGGPSLVIYRQGVRTPGNLLPQTWGLWSVSDLTTDHHSSFLLCDGDSHSVYVLDISGNHTHTIPISGDRRPVDCTVVGRQLWVRCENGNILVMSSK